ncbi:hypothetical protein PWG71_18085 [Nocardiopsis sp. N85]|uniref:hypothetical protein n=1 Tax=Nocardiopsis sp. N85 TaxID=3029400 RepID=UPI00237F9C6F|nr:hypothetical protein [Nocardiopsis sp. N85]MDE3723306.1 hypothetical protein [Nocardiopsis sp. N85]
MMMVKVLVSMSGFKKKLASVSIVLLAASACSGSPISVSGAVEIDHRTAGDLGLEGGGSLESIQEFEELRSTRDNQGERLVRRDDHAIAVTGRGVVGVGPDGRERWRYLVSEDVEVGFPRGTDAIVLVHPVEENSSRMTEVVLDPENGEIAFSSEIFSKNPPDPELGNTETRITVQDGVSAQIREESGESWTADLGAWCGGTDASAADFTLASDAERLYLSILCGSGADGRLVALSLETGEMVWEGFFDGGEAAPEVFIVDSTDPDGPERDIVQRVLQGEFSGGYRYVESGDGNPYTPESLTVAPVIQHLSLPEENEIPKVFLMGTETNLEAFAVHGAASLLMDQGLLTFDAIDDVAYAEENGVPRFYTPMEDVQFFSDVTRNGIVDALRSIEG